MAMLDDDGKDEAPVAAPEEEEVECGTGCCNLGGFCVCETNCA